MRQTGMLLLGLAILCYFSSNAIGEPITYSFLGTGSGTFSGNTGFTDAPFVITSVGDTGGVYPYGFPWVFWNNSLSAVIYISGVGLVTFTEQTRVFVNQHDLCSGFNSFVHADLVRVYNDAFAVWDLISPIGPIFYYLSGLPSQFHDVSTTLGSLTVTYLEGATFFTTSFASPQNVTVDVKPNSINRNKLEQISVAILSGPYLYAPDHVNDGTLTFGRTGDEESFAYCDDRPKDVNRDGLKDLVCYFNTQIAGFQCSDTEGILRGRTVDGRFIEGVDSIKLTPCK